MPLFCCFPVSLAGTLALSGREKRDKKVEKERQPDSQFKLAVIGTERAVSASSVLDLELGIFPE